MVNVHAEQGEQQDDVRADILPLHHLYEVFGAESDRLVQELMQADPHGRDISVEYMRVSEAKMQQLYIDEPIAGFSGRILHIADTTPPMFIQVALVQMKLTQHLNAQSAQLFLENLGVHLEHMDPAIAKLWTAKILGIAFAERCFGKEGAKWDVFLRWIQESDRSGFFEQTMLQKRMGATGEIPLAYQFKDALHLLRANEAPSTEHMVNAMRTRVMQQLAHLDAYQDRLVKDPDLSDEEFAKLIGPVEALRTKLTAQLEQSAPPEVRRDDMERRIRVGRIQVNDLVHNRVTVIREGALS